jgi:hypothetical protein
MPDSQVTGRQQRFLFSSGSPLTQAKKNKLADEMRSGAVKKVGRIAPGHGISRPSRRK